MWWKKQVVGQGEGAPPGRCFNFHSDRGGGGSPLDPSPPPPLALNHLKIKVLGTFFACAQKNSPVPSAHLYQGSLVIPLVSFVPCPTDIMSQRSISAFFGSPVQPCPRAKRNDVITAILYFRFQDRWTGKKRQEAYNAAQKACSTLFLNTPMATLCEFVQQAAIMAQQDCEVCCLPYEFLLMQPVLCARWAAQLP